MAQSNHERVGRALELLNRGLKPFIEREMQAVYGARWQQEAAAKLRDYQVAARAGGGSGDVGEPNWDTQVLLIVMWEHWYAVFKNVLGHAERSLVSELREVRNKWAHQESFSTDDAYRALDSIQRLLTAVSASAQAGEVERQKHEVLRIRFEEQARNETRKVTASLESRPASGLRPWREVVTPQPDVASGGYLMAEFAADLAQVYKGLGSDEYRVPRDFFQRTFLTNGLRKLLVGALQRLSGRGGDPVVDLQTSFGGGKTHSLLALYHLFSGVPLSDLVGMEPVLQEAGVSQPIQAQRAVLVGTELSPGLPRVKEDGCVIHTLWGELAWQLLGHDGYAFVADADRQGVSPGSAVLRELFAAAAPCLILIDEWVVYARQLYGVSNLPAGTFDANLSFAQSLTEAAKAAPQTLVVATIPASDAETGGEGGREAAARLKHLFGRIESSWRPADVEESFEIVRRRLFQNITQPALFVARDTVAKAFADLYRSQAQEFPAECRESGYEQRIKAAYPIHPELFDRLYSDWSSIEKFQRTRGVLRLMAAVVHTLWQRQDGNLLILPASVPIDEQTVQSEMTRYLEDNWVPVMEKDVDGPHSLPLRMDSNNTTLGRYSASRRVARTIYLGSAPNVRSQNKGLTDNQIKLGCVQPGESVATFGDALRRLSDQSTHLYLDGQRYWYATQPSVTRVAQDRAAQYDDDPIYEEIERRLRSERDSRADFGRVHPCPHSSMDVGDDDAAVRLVILRPHLTHSLRNKQSLAVAEAEHMRDQRGTIPRVNRNTIVFLAADNNRLEDLKQGVRQYLAWNSIQEEREVLNLDAFQSRLASTKREEAHKAVEARIPETYIWLLIPDQPDPLKPVLIQELRLQPQQWPLTTLTANASRKLKAEEMLITHYAGTLLRAKMDEIPLWRGNHVRIKDLAEYFARYIYLPRLKNTEVLLAAIQNGLQSLMWEQETFAYADSWDEQQQRYLGLLAGQQMTVSITATNLLVKPDVAAAQLQADREEAARKQAAQERAAALAYRESQARQSVVLEPGAVLPPMPEVAADADKEPTGAMQSSQSSQSSSAFPTPIAPIGEPHYHRFFGAVKVNPLKIAGEVNQVVSEVIQHLVGLDKNGVTITLEIQANIPGGVPPDIVRAVQENCNTLHFESFSFEEE